MAYLIKCGWVVKKAAAVRRYRRTRRIVKGAGAATVKRTAARKVATWFCVAVPLAAGVGGAMWAGLPPHAGGGMSIFSPTNVVKKIDTGYGTLGSSAEAGDVAIIYLPPGYLEQAEIVGTLPPVAFAPVPDFPFPTPTVPQPPEIGPATPDTAPETPSQPTPVPEPSSGALLTGAVAAMLMIWRKV